ncbi:MAG TPA: hypothetical protein VHE81_18145 [Lacipirellulaceae bacterium]|nr:hypothetical protein [Lacipirellulaceae bacterium]
MDQLRTALVWLQRQHFWVLSGLVALIALGCWAKASSQLNTLFKKNQTTIIADFDSVKKVQSEAFHPNDDVNVKQEAETTKQEKSVAKLWQQLYDRQRSHVLTWPEQLSKDFRDYVEKLQFGDEIEPKWRSHYQNYVEGHFPELPKQIDARPLDITANISPAGGPSGYSRGSFYGGLEGPGAASPGSSDLQDEGDYICEWDAADQAKIRSELNFLTRPSSLQIWVTQEDLWVYHTLLDVIAKTNQAAHASRMSNAAVKSVAELSVGWPAAKYNRTANRLSFEPPAPAAGTGPGNPGLEGAAAPPGGPPTQEFSPDRMSPGAGGQMTEEQERAALLSGRYLGPDGKPIPFGAAGGATPGVPAETSAAPAQPLDLTVFGQEYKRLPVRMVLWMNERWLPYLIATCANESLQIEVQEVRINTADEGGAGGGPGGGSYRGPSPGGAGASSIPDEAAEQPFPTQPELVKVVIQGTIYIFNKPNKTILQTPGAQPVATTGG